MNKRQDPTKFFDLAAEDSALSTAATFPSWAITTEFSPALFTEERRDLAKIIKNLAISNQDICKPNIHASTDSEHIRLAWNQVEFTPAPSPTGTKIKPVLKKLIDLKVRRHAVAAVVDAHGELHSMSGQEIADKLGELAISVRETLDSESQDDLHDGSDMSDVLENMIRRIERPNELLGLPFGMPELERAVDGLQPGRLMVVAGRPHQGKTTFMMNMAEDLLSNGHNIAFFTLEQSVTEVRQGVLDIHCGEAIKNGVTPTKTEIRTIQKGIEEMQSFSWKIDDSCRLPIDRICNKARSLHQRRKLKAVFIDYLQIIAPSDSDAGDPRIAMNEITAKLKALAKELHVPVITASQINRSAPRTNPETGKVIYGRPALSQMRESASIESDADLVVAPHREPDDEGEEDDVDFDTIIMKNRQTGILKDVPCVFTKSNRRMRAKFA